MLECLALYLAFAFGDWCPPMIPVGIKDDERVVWKYARKMVIGQSKFDRGWISVENHAHARQSFQDGFAGFARLYEKSNW